MPHDDIATLLARAANGDTVVLPPCDWGYWAALARRERYVDENDSLDSLEIE